MLCIYTAGQCTYMRVHVMLDTEGVARHACNSECMLRIYTAGVYT